MASIPIPATSVVDYGKVGVRPPGLNTLIWAAQPVLAPGHQWDVEPTTLTQELLNVQESNKFSLSVSQTWS